MDCKDLMVNDFVKYNGVTKMVDAIYLYSVSVHDPIEEWSISEAKTFPVDDIEPIKLTSEILVKNGFVYQEAEETCATNAYHHWQLDGEYLALDDFQYWRKEKKDDLPRFCIAGIDVNYVHQLQHLLRLCGVEKELVID
jgi:hypothetical protein